MVKLNYGEMNCYYSEVFKQPVCDLHYNAPRLSISLVEVPLNMFSMVIDEMRSAMNRALQYNDYEAYNKINQDLSVVTQELAKAKTITPTIPAPTPPPPPPTVPVTTMVPQKPSIVPVEEWKPQAYVSPPPPPPPQPVAPAPAPQPPPPTAPPPTQPAAPPPVQPQIQPQPPMEKKEEEEKRIDLKKLALLGLIGYLLMRKK
jgi:hypothetical protein